MERTDAWDSESTVSCVCVCVCVVVVVVAVVVVLFVFSEVLSVRKVPVNQLLMMANKQKSQAGTVGGMGQSLGALLLQEGHSDLGFVDTDAIVKEKSKNLGARLTY